MKTNMFQFHKVRLKDIDDLREDILSKFQFHKVRLKAFIIIYNKH